jgi:hypothetical protein
MSSWVRPSGSELNHISSATCVNFVLKFIGEIDT